MTLCQAQTQEVSYPTAKTNQFPKELDLLTLCQTQTQDANWAGKLS